jgi:hypothetical protein
MIINSYKKKAANTFSTDSIETAKLPLYGDLKLQKYRVEWCESGPIYFDFSHGISTKP